MFVSLSAPSPLSVSLSAPSLPFCLSLLLFLFLLFSHVSPLTVVASCPRFAHIVTISLFRAGFLYYCRRFFLNTLHIVKFRPELFKRVCSAAYEYLMDGSMSNSTPIDSIRNVFEENTLKSSYIKPWVLYISWGIILMKYVNFAFVLLKKIENKRIPTNRRWKSRVTRTRSMQAHVIQKYSTSDVDWALLLQAFNFKSEISRLWIFRNAIISIIPVWFLKCTSSYSKLI